jgi:hypothetical protein
MKTVLIPRTIPGIDPAILSPVSVQDGIIYKKYRDKAAMEACIIVAKKLHLFTDDTAFYGNGYRVKVLIPVAAENQEATATIQLVNATPVGNESSFDRMVDVVDAVSVWYGSVQQKSLDSDQSLALHGDLNLNNILLDQSERTIYIIDPMPEALSSSLSVAQIDIHHFLMSAALTKLPHYKHFVILAELFLKNVEPHLMTCMPFKIGLRTHLLLVKFMVLTTLKNGKKIEIGAYFSASGFIMWFLTVRWFQNKMMSVNKVLLRIFKVSE